MGEVPYRYFIFPSLPALKIRKICEVLLRCTVDLTVQVSVQELMLTAADASAVNFSRILSIVQLDRTMGFLVSLHHSVVSSYQP